MWNLLSVLLSYHVYCVRDIIYNEVPADDLVNKMMENHNFKVRPSRNRQQQTNDILRDHL